MRVRARCLSTALAACGLWAVPAAGLDVTVPGRLLVVRSGERVRFVSNAEAGAPFALPAPGSDEDPTVGGALLAISDAGLVAGSVELELEASGWRGLGRPAGSRGYEYRSRHGDCRRVLLTRKQIRAVCRGELPLATPFADAATLVLGLGEGATALRYCAEFGGDETQNDEVTTRRRHAPAPPACPVVECPMVPFLPSAEVAGACFILSPGTSCAELCSLAGLRYSEATRSFAGSDGTLAGCSEVLGALGFAAAADGDCESVGIPAVGCAVLAEFGLSIRCTAPSTTADAAHFDVYRACACR